MRRLVPLALLASLAAAHGQAVTGETMLELCSSGDQTTKTICIGYVRGFMDGSVYQATVSKQKTFYCLGNTAITYPGLADAFRKYLEAHRGDLGQPGGVLFAKAMREQFACK